VYEVEQKLLIDTAHPGIVKELFDLGDQAGHEIWGATTNPSHFKSAVEAMYSDQKFTKSDARQAYKDMLLGILDIVPGAVSAQVYADETTLSPQMVQDGLELSDIHERIVVKLPTNREGIKARTELRKKGISTNMTVVFSQAQGFAVDLNEKLIQAESTIPENLLPNFKSPFVHRLQEETGQDGHQLVIRSIALSDSIECAYPGPGYVWTLAASIREIEQLKRALYSDAEAVTANPAVLKTWFTMSEEARRAIDTDAYASALADISVWEPEPELYQLESLEDFDTALDTGVLDINHPLVEIYVRKFAADAKAILRT
jgi:transaldolase